MQLSLLSLGTFSAQAQCRAAVRFWRWVLGLLLPAVLLAQPQPATPPVEGRRRRREGVAAHSVPTATPWHARLSQQVEGLLYLLRPPASEPWLPPQPWLLSAALWVPWLLRWAAVLSLVWAVTLLAHREPAGTQAS